MTTSKNPKATTAKATAPKKAAAAPAKKITPKTGYGDGAAPGAGKA